MKRTLVASLILSVVGFGCGGDEGGASAEGPTAKEGTANPATMKAAVGTADTMNSSLAAMSGDGVAGAALSMSNSGMGAVSPKQGALTLEEMKQVIFQTGTTGTKTCTATGCTYDKYGNGQFTMTGSVNASDGGAGVSGGRG